MRSLGGIATRTLRRSSRRYALTAVGATLGVAVLFAILVTSAASTDALREAIDGGTGRADVVVSPSGSFDAVLPAGAPDAVRSLEGVETVVGTVSFRSAYVPAVDAAGAGGERTPVRERIIFVGGIGDDFRTVNDLDVVDGRDPTPGAAEVVIPRRLADSIGVGVGDTIAVATPTSPAQVTVVGLLADRGAATSNQGDVAYTSAEFARTLLGRAAGLTGLQVVLEPGVDTADWIASNRTALAGVSVQDADDIAAGFAEFIAGITGALTLVAAVAVFIGGFLVYLTFSVAVAERTRVLGTLRALGATARRVRRLVLIEATILGAICALLGLAVGYVLAGVAVGVVGTLLDLDLGGVGAPVGAALVSAVVGTGVAAGAALVPARRAAAIDPVSAMRGGALAIERSPRRWLGPTLLALGVILGSRSGSIGIQGLGMLLILMGGVLSVHLAVGPVARLVGALTARLSPGTGSIAVRHLRLERTRSSFTLALVMVALSVSLAVASTNQSLSATLENILDRQAGAIQVGAPGAIDDAVAAELAAVEGVGTISPVRFGTADIGEADPVNSFVQIIDPATYFEVSSFPYVEGDDATVSASLTAGGAVVLPGRDANRLGVTVGDSISVTTVAGPASFEVAGIYDVIGGGFGAVFGLADLDRVGGGRVNGYLVGTNGTDPETVASRIRSSVAEPRQLIVDSPEDSRQFARAQTAGFFGIAYAILVVALVISLLGLANTLVVTVLDRTREIGVLRSGGARRRQIRSMILVEAVTMALVALVLALPLSAVLALGITGAQRTALTTTLDYVYPFGLVLPLGLVAVAVAAVASAFPARRAGRLEIVDALRFE